MNHQYGRSTVLAALAGLVVGATGGWLAGSGRIGGMGGEPAVAVRGAAPGAAAPGARAAPVMYSFEADRPVGWTCGDYEKSLACTGVGHSNVLHRDGLASLKVEMDLSGGTERRGSGEVWVDVNNVVPATGPGPVNLAGRTLTAWVYAPPGSVGDRDRPNGFQLFVKDKDWNAKYGPWHDVQEGQWMQVSFPVGPASEGFDPSAVSAIGLKFASGEGSREKFQGPIYLDAVGW